MSDHHLAFMIGLFGSIHCVGMCGPLAFAVPTFREGWFYLVFNKLLYQVGRIISYSMLGILIGLTGKQLWLSGLQQGLSIASGILILAAAVCRFFKFSFAGSETIFLKKFDRLFGLALKHRANHLIIGMLNGLLPCGFVYLAMAGAINTGGIVNAVSYMCWYGLGTLPLMFLAGISTGFTSAIFRKKMNKAVPYFMLCLGIWFVLRGLELNIPYLSPASAQGQISNCG